MKRKKWRFKIPIKTEEELRLFVEKAWGVKIPDVQVCPNHSTPWRAFSEAYFARTPVSVWKASRGFGGKSFLLAILALTEAVTLKASVNVLGGSGEQSQNVLAYMNEFWTRDEAPRQLLASDPAKTRTRLKWGNTIKALTASQRSVRGPHPQRLRLDEIDEMTIPILDSALGQPMSKGKIQAQTVLSSTHQYSDGTMTEVLTRARDREWPVHEWCWRESVAGGEGWLSEAEVEEKRSTVTIVMWETEYELQDPSPESRAIDTEKVALMFRLDLGKAAGGNGVYLEFEEPKVVCDRCHEEPPDGKEVLDGSRCPCGGKYWSDNYVTGADWAKSKDWTVIVTVRTDVNPYRVVAFERCGRMPWPIMVGKFNDRLRRFPGMGMHDATGLGGVIDDYLEMASEGFLFVGRARTDLLSEYVNGIENEEIVSPFIDFMEAEHRLASVDHLYGAKHLPDSIAAGALAYRIARVGQFVR